MVEQESEVAQVGLTQASQALCNWYQRHIAKDGKEFTSMMKQFPIKSGENQDKHKARVMEEYRFHFGRQ
jgi:hypothetical protein